MVAVSWGLETKTQLFDKNLMSQQEKNSQDNNSLREAIRENKRKLRRDLSSRIQEKNSKKISIQISKLQYFLNANNIASYIESDGEISTSHLHKLAWKKNKKVFLPHIEEESKMSFFYFQKGKALKNGPWGTFEIESPKIEKKISEMDLIIVPMVAFDKNGNRLGRGGGFYDRVLSESNITSKNKIYGLAHDIQEVERIPIKENDIPMNGIIIPNQIIDC